MTSYSDDLGLNLSVSHQRPAHTPGPTKPRRVKILTAGPTMSGKSCMVKRYCEQKFYEKYVMTIGIDYGIKTVRVDGAKFKCDFWDMSGRQEFKEIRNEFYQNTSAAIFIFDLTNAASFRELDFWEEEARSYGVRLGEECPVSVVGNKLDKPRMVPEDEAREWAASRGFQYFETSAKTGANVDQVFEDLIRRIS